MKRIRLSKNDKRVLRLLVAQRGCPSDFPSHIYAASIDSLELHGLAKGMWAEGHTLVDARITDKGKEYLALNPRLLNPVDWKWALTTAISLIGVLVALVALFISCQNRAGFL